MRFSHFGPTRFLCEIAVIECLSYQEALDLLSSLSFYKW